MKQLPPGVLKLDVYGDAGREHHILLVDITRFLIQVHEDREWYLYVRGGRETLQYKIPYHTYKRISEMQEWAPTEGVE